MKKFWVIIIPILLLYSCKKTHDKVVAPPQLSRGINLSNWFNDYSDSNQFANRFTPAHIAKLKQLGFTFVRIPIGNTILFQQNTPSLLKSKNLALVDNAVNMILNAGLAVIINYQPYKEDYEKLLYANPQEINNLATYWKSVAHYFKKYPSDQLVFEVYNEPHVGQESNDPDGWRWWWPQQEKLVQAIRKETATHYIVVGGENYNSIEYLVANSSYAEKNIIYNFHFYHPYEFTHQGATWIGNPYQFLKYVPYPSNPQNIATSVSATNDSLALSYINYYGKLRWGMDTLDKMIQVAQQWASNNSVPLMCNEFGAFKVYASPVDRALYLHDVRTTLEKYNIVWSMWECDETFGILTYPNANRNDFNVDINVENALGLQ